ncbi:MAG TPA: transporter substrate-binding domain-containing protein [Candidatus Limnocylindria bacterium]|nr:transporter substrate-binding domain-containing protein [Candidatus Limnocylindria bacterium]
MRSIRAFAILAIVALILAACSSGTGESPSESAAASEGGSTAPSESAAAEGPICDSYSGDDYLGRICDAGKIIVSTDPAYPPQSSLNAETGEYEGFDIDVANEIGARLGVDVEFTDPPFDAVQGGNWSGRWDMSVGSVTITETRQEVLDFTQPYYFTPAQFATTDGTGIESVDDFSGTTVCVAEGTTYFDWLNGTLTLAPEAGEVADVPADITPTTLPTDINCAEAWKAGRSEFQGWLSSSTTVDGAVNADYPVIPVGDPVFFEPLAVCFDNTVEDNDSLVDAVDQIITDMHDDGTLTQFSEDWYEGQDLTTQD